MTSRHSSVKTLEPTRQAGRKYFELDEAQRALPYVSRVVADIQQCYGQALELRQRLDRDHPEDDVESLRRDYDRLMDRLNGYLDELRLVGVELKDFEKGLVDFPAWHHDREVCLCWKHGETTIGAWHETNAGFAGRQDISSLQ